MRSAPTSAGFFRRCACRCARPGPTTNGLDAEVLLAHLDPLRGEARHDRGDADLVDRARASRAPLQREEALQQAGDLVAGAVAHRGDAPVVDDLAAVDAGRWPSACCRRRRRAASSRLQVEAEVDPRRARGQGADGDDVDAGLGERAHALEAHAAGDLDQRAAGDAGRRPRAPRPCPCCRAARCRRPAGQRLVELRPACRPRPRGRARARRRRARASTAARTPPAAATWLSLIMAPSKRPKRCGVPPPWHDGLLLEGAQPRRRLARAGDARPRAGGLGHVARRERRDAGEAAEEVERRCARAARIAGQRAAQARRASSPAAKRSPSRDTERRRAAPGRRARPSPRTRRAPESTPASRATTRAAAVAARRRAR